jgi:poly-beta-1,6-N-acetyl-D-glucosamine synthase
VRLRGTLSSLKLAVAVIFLNEERLLPRLLESIVSQTRLPDRLLLVDDGSDDASTQIAQAFVERHAFAELLQRPQRERVRDRLANADVVRAFQWAVAQLDGGYDVVAKMDADLELTPVFFERVVGALEADPKLGVTGASLLRVPAADGTSKRERSKPWHIRGPTKFYRWECYEDIAPLPAILGWDTIDEERARMRGWRVASVPLPEGDPLHLRPTGSYDGALRSCRRQGVAAWGYGSHPVNVLASALVRMQDRPRIFGGLVYLAAWLDAAMRRRPRAEPELVRFVRQEQRQRIRDFLVQGINR